MHVHRRNVGCTESEIVISFFKSDLRKAEFYEKSFTVFVFEKITKAVGLNIDVIEDVRFTANIWNHFASYPFDSFTHVNYNPERYVTQIEWFDRALHKHWTKNVDKRVAPDYETFMKKFLTEGTIKINLEVVPACVLEKKSLCERDEILREHYGSLQFQKIVVNVQRSLPDTTQEKPDPPPRKIAKDEEAANKEPDQKNTNSENTQFDSVIIPTD